MSGDMDPIKVSGVNGCKIEKEKLSHSKQIVFPTILSTKLNYDIIFQSLNDSHFLYMCLAPESFQNTLAFISLKSHDSSLTQIELNNFF